MKFIRTLIEAAVAVTDISKIDIDSINPDQKDWDRAAGFSFDTSFGHCYFYGNQAPHSSGAKKMAPSIKDPIKLVRRSKAVVGTWGTRSHTGYSGGKPKEENVWTPFYEALREMGFSRDQISKIEDYQGEPPKWKLKFWI